jgi:hypothetical protein
MEESLGLRPPSWVVEPLVAESILHLADAGHVILVGTQLVATVIAVFGWFMPAIGWGWALGVWGYALAWFFVNDRVKLAAYRVFDAQQPELLQKSSWPSQGRFTG